MINTDPDHRHTYDENGYMTCCSLEDKINSRAEEEHDHTHDHHFQEGLAWKEYVPAAVSFILLVGGIVLDEFIQPGFFKNYIRLTWYIAAYLPVAIPVIRDAVKAILKGDVFTEFFLMTLATTGAFAILQYPEAVTVMLFYAIGELVQSAAVKGVKRSIKSLLDIRPDKATLLRNGVPVSVRPERVIVGEIIRVKSGEKVPLDGMLLSEKSSFNTAALTGESKPDTIYKEQAVLAGMINLGQVIEIRVIRKFEESTISRILDMVQHAAARKAKTELFIRKFARIYTPVVVLCATLLVVIPSFIQADYLFADWLYRALIFLVVSCPCALIIAIPLGYFGGIGAASRNGILFKGSNYLDLIAKTDTVVIDKTGTLTKGVFKVRLIKSETLPEENFIALVAALESHSTHPVAKAIVAHSGEKQQEITVDGVEEISGHGITGKWNGEVVLAGNTKLLKKFGIAYPTNIDDLADTLVVVAVAGKYSGYITIADELKPDAKQAIQALHAMSVKTVILSGDSQAVVADVAAELGVDQAIGNLLPEEKVTHFERLKKERAATLAFVGDGINDAPVLALSDVGIAMGGLGSDAAVETADVIIQTDHPSKIATAIQIGKATKKIVWQNIALAFGVKVFILMLGAFGVATMWEAVFADVGVALLAILNAVRIQRFVWK
ncbi:MAG: cadmium-translocating P-type ATPase [Bacteroidetes bacterium]|nr:cadmium-translocating P-type ATPase [Bacteroidota bacterium]